MPVLILLVVAAGGIGGWKLYQQRQAGRDQPPAAETATPAHPLAAPAQPAPPAAPPSTAATPQAQASSAAPAADQPTSPGPDRAQSPPVPARDHNTSATEAAGTPFELTVRPKDSAWVSIKSDGKYVVRGIIRPPDVKTIKAVSQVVFYTGNAGLVDLSFNGKEVPLAAGRNQEQVLVFDSRGLQPAAASPVAAQ